MRLGRRRAFGRGGEPREGRVVNGVQAQVVPKGTIRAVIRSHKKDMAGAHVSDAMAEALRERGEKPKSSIPGMPDSWGLERGRAQLEGIMARARRNV